MNDESYKMIKWLNEEIDNLNMDLEATEERLKKLCEKYKHPQWNESCYCGKKNYNKSEGEE